MRKPIKKAIWVLTGIVLGLIALASLTIIYFEYFDPSVRGWWFRYELLSALDDASTVQVVEHSSKFDSLEAMHDPKYKDTTYATMNLKPEQIEALRNALPLTKDYSRIRITKCLFEEHHYIAITRRDGSVLTLHICFHCGQMILGDHYGDMSEGWEESLSKFVSGIGLHPTGPWPPPGTKGN